MNLLVLQLSVLILPIDPIHRVAPEVTADGGTERWKEKVSPDLANNRKRLSLSFHGIFQFGEARLRLQPRAALCPTPRGYRQR